MKTFCTVIAATLLVCGSVQAQEPKVEEGFTPLFDGKTLDGWQVMNKGVFSVKDGVIFLDKGSGWLRTDKEYQDFELRMDFRFVSKGADSGIFLYASKDGGNWPAKNYQVQTMDNGSIAGLFVSGYSGLKATRDGGKVGKVRKDTGEWQSYDIVAKGGKIEIKLNGETVTTAEGAVMQPGYIGLQGEGGQLEFKNIRIKELK